jgi:hypothetical protein
MRSLDPAVESALEGNTTEVWLLELDCAGGFYRTTTADRDLEHDGNVYKADGALQEMGPLTVRSDGSIAPVQFTFAPSVGVVGLLTDDFIQLLTDEGDELTVEASNISDTLSTGVRFRSARLYFAELDSAHAIVDEAVRAGDYFMSHLTRSGALQSKSVVLTCFPYSVLLRRTNGVIATGEDQKARYTGDTFDDFTDKVVGIEIAWGGFRANVGGSGRGFVESAVVSERLMER